MSKYQALGDYLKRQRRETVPMTFGEIEKLTGTKLPPSSRYRAWWSNNDFNSVLTKVWIEAGFKSEQVDMERCKLVFRRVYKPKSAEAPRSVSDKACGHYYGTLARRSGFTSRRSSRTHRLMPWLPHIARAFRPISRRLRPGRSACWSRAAGCNC